jgi:3-phenylpropionate/cinnamic acid dioxygenase small subunit
VPLVARAEIEDLNARFAWALDLHDFDALAEVFVEDAHYASLGREFHGRDELIASFRARAGARTTRHGLGTLLLAGQPDGAVTGLGSWHTFAAHAETSPEEPAPVGLYMVADFHDRYVETAAGWRIAERIIVPVLREAGLGPGAAGADPARGG